MPVPLLFRDGEPGSARPRVNDVQVNLQISPSLTQIIYRFRIGRPPHAGAIDGRPMILNLYGIDIDRGQRARAHVGADRVGQRQHLIARQGISE